MPERPHAAGLAPLARAVVTLVGLVAGACAGQTDPGPEPPLATIVSVIDGDTVVVRSGGRTEHVRLIGIDTPEVAHHGSAADCFGPEAAERVALLLPEGATVGLSRDLEGRDIYGRLLAYVTTEDGAMVNLRIAQEGLGVPLAISPNLAIADAVADATRHAQRDRRGLWGACPPAT